MTEPTQEDIELISEEVGMYPGAWDMVPPAMIIAACWKVLRARDGTSQPTDAGPAPRAETPSGGIMCGDDGCRPIDAATAEALWNEAMRQEAARTERYPDERSAHLGMHDGYLRLKEMGWREATYAPKGKDLELIESG